MTPNLLVGVLKARPDPNVEKVIIQIMPGVVAIAQRTDANARDHAADWVRDALKGIVAVQANIGDEKVRVHLLQSSDQLTRIANELEKLARYKTLHDSLHRLQIKRLRLVLYAVMNFLTDVAASDSLREYTETVQMEYLRARDAASRLPGNTGEQVEEMRWVILLKQVVDGFRDGLRNRDALRARQAFYLMKKILRQEPFRLDNLMVVSAKRMQLVELVKILESIAGEAGQEKLFTNDLEAGIAGLKLLLPDLLNRVEQHTAWQEIEKDLGRAEEGVLQEIAEPLDELQFLWPDLRRHVGAICVTDAKSEWAETLLADATKFEQALPLPALPPIPAPAKEIFKDFLSTASNQFYLVDQALNEQCGEIIKIGRPLQNLLTAAAQLNAGAP